MEGNEETVSVDALDASLGDLLKAADAEKLQAKLAKAENLSKGTKSGTSGEPRVEYSGHYTEGGTHGGGGADSSDEGGIDDMMIGKLVAAGISPNDAAAFAAFMAGKQEDEEEEEDEDEMEGYMGGMPEAYKSSSDYEGEPFAKSFREDSDIAEAIDASAFMEALTARTVTALDNMHKSMHGQTARQDRLNKSQAVATYQLGQLVKAQAVVITELGKRLGIVERTPNPPKGVTHSATPLNKSMPGEAGHQSIQQPLSKSELVSTMNYMALQKGVSHFRGVKPSEAIVLFESSGTIAPEVLGEVQAWIANNPNEADAARTYR